MKRKISTKLLLIFLIISSYNFINSCANREETTPCFPTSTIDVSINTNLPSYQNLWVVGGWLYLNEQVAGTRGLIIVRTGNSTFRIYDRNAPHICPDQNTTLQVKDNIKIICPKDGAEWILLTGEPTKVSQKPPKTYLNYYFDANSGILTIRN